MGCKNSTERDAAALLEAEDFNRLARENPVAAKLKEEWTAHVKQLSSGRSTSTKKHKDVWASTQKNPVSHRSVDRVGKLFLGYVRSDLASRSWGGNFDYTVVGVAQQGYLKANVTVDVGTTRNPQETTWEIMVHYHSVKQD